MPISILILTYNSSKYIKELLDSIYKILSKDIASNEIEVILFDNASTDNTVDLVTKFGENILIKKSDKNLGYAKGINKAAEIAKGELLVVINPDSKLVDFDKEKITSEFIGDKKLAIAGMNVEDFNGVKEKTAGKFFNPFSFLLYAFGLESIIGMRFSPEKTSYVDFVSGGFVAFRKEFFDEVKGYDEDYFMYVEDMDICYRAKEHGYKTAFLPYGTISHKGQGSSNREFAIASIYKGLKIFYEKHHLSQLQYIKNLLVIKAQLIIFLGVLLGRKDLSASYKKALLALK